MTQTKKTVPEARRQQIMDWLADEGSISIRELQSRLRVSHMTVHRDLDTLAAKDLIRKVHAGVILIEQQENRQNVKVCAMCATEISRRSEFVITRKGGVQVNTCCPHCGILMISNEGEEESALARDYLYGRMVNVFQASYVIGSEVRLCCVPAIHCFSGISDAEKFSRGFGGQVMNFSQVKIHLNRSHQHGQR